MKSKLLVSSVGTIWRAEWSDTTSGIVADNWRWLGLAIGLGLSGKRRPESGGVDGKRENDVDLAPSEHTGSVAFLALNLLLR